MLAYNFGWFGIENEKLLDQLYFEFDWIGRCLVFIVLSVVAKGYVRFISFVSLALCLIGYAKCIFGDRTAYNNHEYIFALIVFTVIYMIFYIKNNPHENNISK